MSPNNPFAFPVAASTFADDQTRYSSREQEGMTIRDWFAGNCIEKIISLSADDGGWDPVTVAAGCYAMADAMLAQREL